MPDPGPCTRQKRSILKVQKLGLACVMKCVADSKTWIWWGGMMKFQMVKPAHLVAFACAAAIPLTDAHAAVYCAGSVASVSISDDGWMTTDWGFGTILLCNMSVDSALPAPQLSITSKTCQSWYSTILTAKSTGRQLTVLLPNASTCAGFGPNLPNSQAGNQYIRTVGIGN